MSIEAGTPISDADERLRPPPQRGWRRNIESRSRKHDPEYFSSREQKKKAAEAAAVQERPKTGFDLLKEKLNALSGDAVKREELRRNIAEAEHLFEEVRQNHSQEEIAAYEEKRKTTISESLNVARHLADVYDQIATWGDAERLTTHLEAGGEIIDPYPGDAREEALARHRQEAELKQQRSETYKKLGQLDRGRADEADEEARETKGLQADDLTLPYKDRLALAEKKIVARFTQVKGRAPEQSELDQLIYGQKQAGTPLSLKERAGQWFRRLGEVTLGEVFDRFADTSIAQAVADFKKLEDEYTALKDTYNHLDQQLQRLEAHRERIQAQAKSIDPEKQRRDLERTQALFRMKVPTRKEVAREGKKLSTRERELEKKRRALAREDLSRTDQEFEEILATEEAAARVQGDTARLKELQARRKGSADQEEADRAAAEALKKAVFDKEVESRLAQWKKALPSALKSANKTEALQQAEALEEAIEDQRKKIIDELRAAQDIGPEPAADAPEAEKERYRDALEAAFMGLDSASIQGKKKPTFSDTLRRRAKGFAVMSQLAMEPQESDQRRAQPNPAKIINTSAASGAPPSQDWTSITHASAGAPTLGAMSASASEKDTSLKPDEALPTPPWGRNPDKQLVEAEDIDAALAPLKALDRARSTGNAPLPESLPPAPVRSEDIQESIRELLEDTAPSIEVPTSPAISSGSDADHSGPEIELAGKADIDIPPEEMVAPELLAEPTSPVREPRQAKYMRPNKPASVESATPAFTVKPRSEQPKKQTPKELTPADIAAKARAAAKQEAKNKKRLAEKSGKSRKANGSEVTSTTRSGELDVPEISISDSEELIDNPEAENQTEALHQAIEAEASSLLVSVLEAARKIPLDASPGVRAKLIKDALDKIPLSSSDWRTPERTRVLDQVRETRDSSLTTLAREDVGAEMRTALNHQVGILNDLLELTSRSTRGQEEYVRSRASKKGELALRLTPEQKRDKENSRFVESKLIGEMSAILKNLPDELLGRPTPSELYLHTYKALREAPSLKALYALRQELSQQGSKGEVDAINESIRGAFYTASQAVKGRIPALERLAGRDRDAQERLTVMRQLPDVFEDLLLEDPSEQRAHVEEIVQKEYQSLTGELARIDTFFAKAKKPEDLDQQVEQRRLANKSADLQLTIGAIQSLAEEVGIDLPATANSTDQRPSEEPLEKVA